MGPNVPQRKDQVLGPAVRTTRGRAGWRRGYVHRPEVTGFFHTSNRGKKNFTMATDEQGGSLRSGTHSGLDTESMRKSYLLLWVGGGSSQGSRKQSSLVVSGAWLYSLANR